jgi:GNAT superfamily N-acetyltransferase
MDLTTRPATLADLDTLVPLFEGYRSFYEQPPDPDLAREFLGARLAQEDSAIYLAEREGRALGFVQLYPIFSSTRCRRLWLLNDLFVLPEGRGRGVARALMAVARRHAEATGSCGLELATARSNRTAQRLYESLGWVRDDVFLHYELGLEAEGRHAPS